MDEKIILIKGNGHYGNQIAKKLRRLNYDKTIKSWFKRELIISKKTLGILKGKIYIVLR